MSEELDVFMSRTYCLFCLVLPVYIMHYLLALTYTDQHLVQCEPTAYSKTRSRLPSEYQNRFHSNYRKHGKGETDHVSITGNYIE